MIVKVEDDTPGLTVRVVSSELSGNQSYDVPAVFGISKPAPYYAFGGKFEGGFAGVNDRARLFGTRNRVAFYGDASGETWSKYGT